MKIRLKVYHPDGPWYPGDVADVADEEFAGRLVLHGVAEAVEAQAPAPPEPSHETDASGQTETPDHVSA